MMHEVRHGNPAHCGRWDDAEKLEAATSIAKWSFAILRFSAFGGLHIGQVHDVMV